MIAHDGAPTDFCAFVRNWLDMACPGRCQLNRTGRGVLLSIFESEIWQPCDIGGITLQYVDIALRCRDEAHFWLNGYVNKQNCRIWSEANPQVYVETPLHPEKLTVWCALWAGGIIGPYFFKIDEGL
ncbi:hypothetical protein TNCV_4240771, partial [Trichonephila clavipes]